MRLSLQSKNRSMPLPPDARLRLLMPARPLQIAPARRLALIALLVCAACNRPDEAVIPTEPATFDRIKSDIDRLSTVDREALMRYMVRTRVSTIPGGRVVLQPGTTIRQAIDAQRSFEAEQQAKEAAAVALKEKIELERTDRRKALDNAVQVVLLSFRYAPSDFELRRYSNTVQIELGIENKTDRNIAGIQGITVFRDLFGNEMRRVRLRYDKGVTAGKTVTWRGSIDVNQFDDKDRALSQLEPATVKFAFEPDMIVFRDGTSLKVEP